MGRSTYAKEQAAIAYQALAKYVSVHTADPLLVGGSEVTGGAYARVLATANAGAVDGSVAITANINIPAGTTILFIGYWDALTAGNYYDSNSITSQAFATAGVYAYSGTMTAS